MALVMVVEDEAFLRESMVRSLRRLPGVEVVAAGLFSEARALMHDEWPALLISDISLPDQSAVGLLAELDAADMHVPVIFITAYLGRYRDRIPVRDDVEVYEKPVRMRALRELVLKRLDMSRAERRAPFSVAEYLQLAGLGNHSAVIRVARAGEQIGWIRIVRGELWSARAGRLRGPTALQALAFATEVSVQVEALAGLPGPQELHGPLEATLLDAFRAQDEALRVGLASVDLDEMIDGIIQRDAAEDIAEEDESLAEWTSAPLVPRPAAAPAGDPLQPPTTRAFSAAMEEGLDALLSRDYHLAWLAFSRAEEALPGNPVVRANLARIRQLGHAPDDT